MMSARPTLELRPKPNVTYQPTCDDEYAFKRRRNHAQIEAMTGRILQAVGYPTKRHRDFICALQAAHGGGDDARVPYTQFRRSHLSLASYMQVSGTDENKRKFIYREIVTLQKFMRATGILLFHVTPGSQQETTMYIDYLTPAADAAMQRALSSPHWQTDKRAAIDEAVAWAVEQLPRVEIEPESAEQNSPQSLDDYMDGQTDSLRAALEKRFDGIEEKNGNADDCLAFLDRVYAFARRDIESRRKTLQARRDFTSLTVFDEAETPVVAIADEEGDGTKVSRPPSTEANKNAAAVNDDPPAGLGAAALYWASLGIPVHPLHEVIDGICTCTCTKKKCNPAKGIHGCGSECKNKGKHPRTLKGKDEATCDPARIGEWWARWPSANIGGVMGGTKRLLAVDVDPRNGGDASLHDLIQAYGDEWLDTWQHSTGGGGFHFFYHVPPDVEIQTDELAPGIDVKFNGYVILPPSEHASGRRYEIEQKRQVRLAPEWMLADLTRAQDEPAPKVVNFQERRDAYSSSGQFFAAGERNNGLRDVMCGRWCNGWATDAQDLFEQMREVRHRRCEVIPGDPPMSDTELWDLVQRTVRKYARGESRRRGGAA